jgi:hypothetical protein
MIIIGCDYHPGFQQIAFVDTEPLLAMAPVPIIIEKTIRCVDLKPGLRLAHIGFVL